MRPVKRLLQGSWLLYAASLFLPVAHSTTLNASRATYGWEIVLGFPLLIINPMLLAHPFVWVYITALFATNFSVLLTPRFYRRIVQGDAPTGLFLGLALGVGCAASVGAGLPTILGVGVDRLLVGYYCWAASIVTASAALLWARGGRGRAPRGA